MTLRTAHLLTVRTAAIAITTLIFTTLTAPPRPLHAETPTAPCALLSPLQIKTVLTTPVLDGKPGTPPPAPPTASGPTPRAPPV